jgi:hypothetical protein
VVRACSTPTRTRQGSHRGARCIPNMAPATTIRRMTAASWQEASRRLVPGRGLWGRHRRVQLHTRPGQRSPPGGELPCGMDRARLGSLKRAGRRVRRRRLAPRGSACRRSAEGQYEGGTPRSTPDGGNGDRSGASGSGRFADDHNEAAAHRPWPPNTNRRRAGEAKAKARRYRRIDAGSCLMGPSELGCGAHR